MKLWPLSLLLLSLASIAAELAPSSGPGERAPITIEADSMELNQGSGTNHYRGNVVLVRGTLQIRADSILLYTRGKQLQRAVAEGNPVHLQQQGSSDDEPMRAESLYMEYLPQSESIELKGKAQLWRDGNKFSGDRIRYDLRRQTVKASGDEQGEGRVRVLLQPTDKDESVEENP